MTAFRGHMKVEDDQVAFSVTNESLCAEPATADHTPMGPADPSAVCGRSSAVIEISAPFQ